MKFFGYIVLFFIIDFSYAQGNENSLLVDKAKKAIYINAKVQYPQKCREQGTVGRVYLKFMINTSGEIINPIVLYSSGNLLLDNEAIRVINSVSKSYALEEYGKEITTPTTFVLPFDFSLDNLLQQKLIQKAELSKKSCEKASKAYSKKNYIDAKNNYKNALLLNPENEDAISNLGMSYFQLNQKDSACYYWNEMKLRFHGNAGEELIKKYCTN